MKIAVDVRRIHDFGVGTYIRNLLQALSQSGCSHTFDLICRTGGRRSVLPVSAKAFRTVPYARLDASRFDHFDLPRGSCAISTSMSRIFRFTVCRYFCRGLTSVTVHDLSSLFL